MKKYNNKLKPPLIKGKIKLKTMGSYIDFQIKVTGSINSLQKLKDLLIKVDHENKTYDIDYKILMQQKIGMLSRKCIEHDEFDHSALNEFHILEEFVNYVAQQAKNCDNEYLVDAYCGSGLFALCLAPQFREVAAVEVSEAAVEWAKKNALKNNITNATFLAASAEAIFDGITFPANKTTVVIDPPRKGCTPEFLAQLIAFAPRRVVYVSCDPATQVRDLSILTTAGFTLTSVQPFDLFPHTRHVESIMTFDGPLAAS